MRDSEDLVQDRSRNITILEKLRDNGGLPTRLKFYYGKELFEMQKPQEAVHAFDEYLKCSDTDHHDRMLAYQYAAYASYQVANQIKDELKEEKFRFIDKSISYAQDGAKLDPSRAEYHVAIGDAYLVKGDLIRALVSYGSAKYCLSQKAMGSPYASAVFSFDECYGITPSIQVAKCYFHMGKLEDSEREVLESLKVFPDNKELISMRDEIEKVKGLINLDNGQAEVDDIVITTPPQTAYPFDEEIYKTKGLGGSETALVQVSRWLKKLTKYNVKVFNMRDEQLIGESGVEWLSNKHVNEYFSKNRPKLHIAWRHNVKITKAPTYLWCHDLVTPTVESVQNFDKIMCLSEFHKNYVMAKQGVKEDKIMLTSNGLDPQKFDFKRKEKDPNKIVFMSSPDRGLDRAMLICDELIKTHKDIKLHVYYGLENLYKYGLKDLATKLKEMMDARTYVVYHGFTEQSKMYQDVSDAVVLCHPANFIETYCITAIEMLVLGIFPVTRRMGALANTLAEAESKEQAILLEHGANNEQEIKEYAENVRYVLDNKLWEKVSLDPETVSWEKVAKQWINEFGLDNK
jgi:glycosyltransferase involved in cell wall biosynthesis